MTIDLLAHNRQMFARAIKRTAKGTKAIVKMQNPTDRQICSAITLLGERGYPTLWVDSSFKELGATYRELEAHINERGGSVESWLKNMNLDRFSALVAQLKNQAVMGGGAR